MLNDFVVCPLQFLKVIGWRWLLPQLLASPKILNILIFKEGLSLTGSVQKPFSALCSIRITINYHHLYIYSGVKTWLDSRNMFAITLISIDGKWTFNILNHLLALACNQTFSLGERAEESRVESENNNALWAELSATTGLVAYRGNVWTKLRLRLHKIELSSLSFQPISSSPLRSILQYRDVFWYLWYNI